MKALIDRLEWVRLWMVDDAIRNGGGGDSEAFKQLVLDGLLEALAIAEALPEIPVYVDGIEIKPARQPPKPIIERPSE